MHNCALTSNHLVNNESQLTLALSGRAPPVGARHGRTMYQGAHGAPATKSHGPLERVVRPHLLVLGLLGVGNLHELLHALTSTLVNVVTNRRNVAALIFCWVDACGGEV